MFMRREKSPPIRGAIACGIISANMNGKHARLACVEVWTFCTELSVVLFLSERR